MEQLAAEISYLADAIMVRERAVCQMQHELDRERQLLAELEAKLNYMLDWERSVGGWPVRSTIQM